MAISYNKMWKILIDKKINQQDLRLATGISTSVMTKLDLKDWADVAGAIIYGGMRRERNCEMYYAV